MFRSVIAAAAGLNVTDAECLDFLLDAGHATAGQLAELTGLTTGAITSVIRRLEKAGYVVAQRDARDRRRVIVTPRHENLAAGVQLYEAFAARASELLDTYTDEELALLTRYHERMSAIYQSEIERINASGSADLDMPSAESASQSVPQVPVADQRAGQLQ